MNQAYYLAIFNRLPGETQLQILSHVREQLSVEDWVKTTARAVADRVVASTIADAQRLSNPKPQPSPQPRPAQAKRRTPIDPKLWRYI
jgi:hypothetical protein